MIRRAFPIAALLAPAAALAHGSAPIALDVHLVDRGASVEPVVETTYGLIARDAAGQWRLTCEEALSPGLKWWSVERDGRIGMGHASGFATSADGCEFTPATGVETAVRAIERGAGTSGTPAPIFVLLDLYEPGRNLRRSLDGGRTFELVSTPAGLLVNAVRAHPHVPGRVVVTAQDASRGYRLLDSRDLGETWVEHTLELGEGVPKIFAVTRDAIFVRRSVGDSSDLWRSTDSGATFTTVLEPGAQLSFLGEPPDGTLWTAAGAGRLFRSRDEGATWEKLAQDADFTCVRGTADVLYGCVLDAKTNTALLRSTDGGASWQPELRYDEVAGVAQCPADSTVAVCEDYWLLVSIGLKVNERQQPAPTPEDEGFCASAPASLVALAPLALLLARRRRAHRRLG